jgi:hypothetical protein
VPVAVVLVGNPFGESVSDRVSDRVDADARCRQAGLQVLAGEREKVYTCTYRSPTLKDNPIMSACFAIVDGRVYNVSADPC